MYKEIFDRIPSVSELNSIKHILQTEKQLSGWEEYYWAVKNLCVYDTDACDTDLIVRNINNALDSGLNVENEVRIYFDAIKILVTLYSQSGDYEKAIDYLNSLLKLKVEIPDWVYHYEVMAEIRTNRISDILKDPCSFLEKLSKNSNKSSAIVRRQRNIFKQFLVEAERYIELHDNVDVDRHALLDAANQFGLTNSDGWNLFFSTIPGEEKCSSYKDLMEPNNLMEYDETKVSGKIQSALFGNEAHITSNRILEKKYSDVITKLEKLEKEMAKKRLELEENALLLEKLNHENEVLIIHAQEDRKKREDLLEKIQHQQVENQSLKEEIEKASEIKQNELDKVRKDPKDRIIGHVHLYLYSAQLGLASWLKKYLPQSTGDWWRRAVMDSLSYEQRERAQEQNYSTLEQFDLAALLRIMSRNWKRITQVVYLSQSDYDCLQEMFNIRNRWSHMNSNLPIIDDIKYDLDTIADFMSFVGCSKEASNEVRSFRASI